MLKLWYLPEIKTGSEIQKTRANLPHWCISVMLVPVRGDSVSWSLRSLERVDIHAATLVLDFYSEKPKSPHSSDPGCSRSGCSQVHPFIPCAEEKLNARHNSSDSSRAGSSSGPGRCATALHPCLSICWPLLPPNLRPNCVSARSERPDQEVLKS